MLRLASVARRAAAASRVGVGNAAATVAVAVADPTGTDPLVARTLSQPAQR